MRDKGGPGEHRIEIGHGWSIWRWFLLRGAGVPASMLSGLAAPRTAAAIDRLLPRAAAAETARSKAITALEHVIKSQSGDARKSIDRALKLLANGKRPDPTPDLLDGAAPVEELRLAEEEAATLRAEIERMHAEESTAISKALKDIASHSRFREACLWQNRSAVQNAVDRLRDSVVWNRSHRKHEQLVARYLQRYCAKNDTIGFFGPIGWGFLVTSDAEARAQPGDELLSRRTVYFERWGIVELAERLSKQAQFLVACVPPRLMPTMRLEGTVLHHAGRTELPPEIAKLLALCDGVRSASEIAARMQADPDASFQDDSDVYDTLVQLRDRNILCWSLELDSRSPYPERELRRALETAPESVRAETLAALDQLEGARTRVSAGAGNPDALHVALDALEETFVRVTGCEPTRNAGETYAGRTLVYEDCRRDFQLCLGPRFLNRLAPALELVLQSARWYTRAVSERARVAFEHVYDELCSETRQQAIDYPVFFDRIQGVFPFGEDAQPEIVQGVLRDLRERWNTIIAFDHGERRIARTSSALAPGVGRAFTATKPGWPVGRFHSPDLMIAARSAEDALAGRGLMVLGEIHTGKTTLTLPAALKECPFADEILAAERADVAVRGRIRPITMKGSERRTELGPAVEYDFEVESGRARSNLPRSRVLAAADLVVVRTADGVVIATRDRRHSFDLASFFETYFHVATRSEFDMFGPVPHLPRIAIDELVIARERWQFRADQMAFAQRDRGLEQMIEARRWAAHHAIPRHVFAKVPQERKPVFVDFASPLYVEILSKLVRSASTITITEMLPSLDELWLPDAAGNLYTCEIRFTVVDPEPWSPSPTM